MKSQECSFSDIQLDDPTARRNSNPGPHFQLVTTADFISTHCHGGVCSSFFFFLVINVGNAEASGLQASISPADLHGMWYPTVRRTLVCLSKLYRCIDVSLINFSQMVFSCSFSFFRPIHLPICLILRLGVLPESSFPRFISRSLICLHPVSA